MKDWEPISQDEWKDDFSEDKNLIFSRSRILSLSCMFASWLMAFFVAYYVVGIGIWERMSQVESSLLLELSNVGQIIQNCAQFPVAIWGGVSLLVGISALFEIKKRLWSLHIAFLLIFVLLFAIVYQDKAITLRNWEQQSREQDKFQQGIHLVITKLETPDFSDTNLKQATSLWAQNNCKTMWLELQMKQATKNNSTFLQGKMIGYTSLSNLIYQIAQQEQDFSIPLSKLPTWFDQSKHGHETVLSHFNTLLIQLTEQVSPRKLNQELQEITQVDQGIHKLLYRSGSEYPILCLQENEQLLEIRSDKKSRSLGKFKDFAITNSQRVILLQSYQVAQLAHKRPKRLWVARLENFSLSPLSLYAIGQKSGGQTLLWDLNEGVAVARQTFEPWSAVAFTKSANRTYAYKDSHLYFWENYLDANTKLEKNTFKSPITTLETSMHGAWFGTQAGELYYHQDEMQIFTTASEPITMIQIDYSGRFIMFASGKEVEIWDIFEKKRQRKYTVSAKATALTWVMGDLEWSFLVGLADGKILAGTKVK